MTPGTSARPNGATSASTRSLTEGKAGNLALLRSSYLQPVIQNDTFFTPAAPGNRSGGIDVLTSCKSVCRKPGWVPKRNNGGDDWHFSIKSACGRRRDETCDLLGNPADLRRVSVLPQRRSMSGHGSGVVNPADCTGVIGSMITPAVPSPASITAPRYSTTIRLRCDTPSLGRDAR